MLENISLMMIHILERCCKCNKINNKKQKNSNKRQNLLEKTNQKFMVTLKQDQKFSKNEQNYEEKNNSMLVQIKIGQIKKNCSFNILKW